MKPISIVTLLMLLVLNFSTASPVEAAANPISLPSASSSVASPSGAPPAAYLQAVKTLQDNKFGENEIKSFVYQIFSLFDRHVEISNLLLLFADEDLTMRVPEGQINSHQDFGNWYAVIGAKYQSNINAVERIDVQFVARGTYRVDLIVIQQALDREGKYTSFRSRQQWQIVDGGGYWPRIVRYIVDPV